MKLLLIALCFPWIAFAETPEPKAVVQDIFAKAGAPEVAKDAKKQAEVNAELEIDLKGRRRLRGQVAGLDKIELW